MFTGLIESLGTVLAVSQKADVTELRILAPFADELKRGDSVAVSGVCTTVTECGAGTFCVELTNETMRVTRFSTLLKGEPVNLERALQVGSRLDGHIVAGHVDGVALVLSLKKDRTSAELWLNLPKELMRYVAYKGSIAVDGISLTVAAVQGNSCSVAVIPETLQRTTLGRMTAGKKVNIETDILARYVENFLTNGGAAPAAADAGAPLTAERLAEMGW